MNYNLNKVLNRIVEEEDLAKEFSSLNDMDKMYDYCHNLGGGYTEDEFDEGIAEAIGALMIEENDLDENSLGKIAGGMSLGGILSKTAAVALSTLALGGNISMPGAKAASISDRASGIMTSVSTKLDISSKWSKTKEAAQKATDFMKNNKIKVAAGATIAALAFTGVATVVAKALNNSDLETLVNDIRNERSGKKASEMWKEVEKRVKSGETSSLVRKYVPLGTLIEYARKETSDEKRYAMWKEVEKRVKSGESSSLARKLNKKVDIV